MKDLTKGKVLNVILKFALPVLIGNLFSLGYALADTRVIGSLLGKDELAAVGSVSSLSDLLVGFTVGLANGFSVLTAKFYGQGNKDKVRKSFALSLEFGVLIAGVLMIFSRLGLNGLFTWLNVDMDHRAMAAEYITVIIYGLIFGAIYNVLAGSLRAIGDAYTPLYFLILSTVLNVGLDILFVGPMGLHVRGAALATVLSQIIAAALCFIYAWVRYPILRFRMQDFIPAREYVPQLLSGGFSMGLMNSLVAFGTVSLQTAINDLGTDTIVAHMGTRKLSSMYMLPFSVLGTTMATFAGQNYGANRIDRIKEALIKTLAISYVWVVVVQIITWTVSPYLVQAITARDDIEIIKTAVLYQKVDTAFYLICPTITILRNSLQGMGDHLIPVISSGLELVGKVLIALFLTPVLKYWGVIVAEPIVWIIMVIPLIISMVARLKKAGRDKPVIEKS